MILKILRMKDEKIRIVRKSNLRRYLQKMGFEKSFSKSKVMKRLVACGPKVTMHAMQEWVPGWNE